MSTTGRVLVIAIICARSIRPALSACGGNGGPGFTFDRRNPNAARSHEPPRRIDYIFVRGPDRRLRGEPLDPDAIASHDCIVVATHHDAFAWTLIRRHAQLLVDTRGVYLEPAANVVKA